MRIGVTGGRDYRDGEHIRQVLTDAGVGPADVFVHGAARGVDLIAAQVAHRLGARLEPHPAGWGDPCRDTCKPNHRKKTGNLDYCPAAGNYRNQEMVDSGLDVLYAFPGNRGTKDMKERCREDGVPVVEA
jgi:hypothetical protein